MALTRISHKLSAAASNFSKGRFYTVEFSLLIEISNGIWYVRSFCFGNHGVTIIDFSGH